MEPLLMSESHQTAAPWAARLGPGAAATLAPARVARWLLVDEGCIWATRSHGNGQAEDLWIGAGQSLAMASFNSALKAFNAYSAAAATPAAATAVAN